MPENIEQNENPDLKDALQLADRYKVKNQRLICRSDNALLSEEEETAEKEGYTAESIEAVQETSFSLRLNHNLNSRAMQKALRGDLSDEQESTIRAAMEQTDLIQGIIETKTINWMNERRPDIKRNTADAFRWLAKNDNNHNIGAPKDDRTLMKHRTEVERNIAIIGVEAKYLMRILDYHETHPEEKSLSEKEVGLLKGRERSIRKYSETYEKELVRIKKEITEAMKKNKDDDLSEIESRIDRS